ncbi:MAG: hypothetical protein ACREL7_17805 [Longimicrobiales bacterium]
MNRIRSAILPLAILVGCSTACEGVGGHRFVPDVQRELDDAESVAASWIATARGDSGIDATTAIASGYLERLRLGLGSPFRLAEMALDDPRLGAETRHRLAWALLGRTIDQETYAIDPAVLDRIGGGPLGIRPGIGRYHLDLIEGAIRQSADPRGGELAVRLGYALAAAEGAITQHGIELTTRVAALVRDRELAQRDAGRLVESAGESGTDALTLLRRWRANRQFIVEQPPMTQISPEAELHAIELAPRLARVIHDLAQTGGRTNVQPTRPPSPLLGREAALALGAAADSLDAPPQTPVALAARLHRNELLESPWLDRDQRANRERFLQQATSEERFAAELALLGRHSPWDNGPALAALAAAVGLRAYAQEPVWFPGDDGPSTRELVERYGLASVTFGQQVRPAWRPYYRRMLDLALTDLRTVLPSLDLRGLHIVFGDRARPDATLAMHDPRHRTLTLPPLTSAGTLAHEIAHDLDWQVALQRYRVRGDYASDRAARGGSDRFARRVQVLAGASIDAESDASGASDHARRPAEIFARSIDWFVAVSLAARNRSNGYLSSVQDDILTGYGTVRPPDITGNAGNALIAILDDVAPVYPRTREWYINRYGLNRSLTPYELVRKMVEMKIPGPGELADVQAPGSGEARFVAIEQARTDGFTAIDQWLCRAPGATYQPRFEAARRSLVLEAARARARGVALDLARNVAGREGAKWVARRLFDAPGPYGADPDSAVAATLAAIVDRAREAGTAPMPSSVPGIHIVSPPSYCALAPLGSPFVSIAP